MLRCTRVFITLCLLTAATYGASSETEQTAQQLKSLQDRIVGLKQDLDTAHRDRSQAHQQLKQAEKDIGRLSRSIRTTRQSIKEQTSKIKALRIELRGAQKALEQRRQVLAQQIRAAYAMGRQQRIKLLLNQQRPDTVSRMNIYFDYLAHARADSVRETHRMVSRLDALVVQARHEEAHLAELRDKKLAEREALQRGRSTRKQAVAALDRRLNTNEARLKELHANEKQLKTLLAKLNAVVAEFPLNDQTAKPFKLMQGRMPWPTKGALASRFGTRRPASSQRWEGVVISAVSGSPVRAVSHGRVVYADWLRGFGLLTIIDHGQGYMSLYGHNQSLLRGVGDWVASGDVIADVGNSGGRKLDGLYFEIRHKGKPVNPLKWCRKRSNLS